MSEAGNAGRIKTIKLFVMKNRILGLHHITAIAGNAIRNHAFYTNTLGLRMVKKTVNFDDPQTYHLYYGDKTGAPGTILTFFPWERVRQGHNGAGMATDIGYSISADSVGFWSDRFSALGIRHTDVVERFGEKILAFQDPDGLSQHLVVSAEPDLREGWASPAVQEAAAIKGFHSVTLTLRQTEATSRVLTEVFGYQFVQQEGNRYRFRTDAIDGAAIVDLLEEPTAPEGLNAGGTNHHVAFRVKDDELLMEFRQKIVDRGLHITPKIDRDYFFSLYFREPGGVLFELATDNPGFTKDETLKELGTHLKLPRRYEAMRATLEQHLPTIG